MVTSIENLKEMSIQEIDLPPFADGLPFKARVKRAGLIDMMYNGKIANPLLTIAFEIAGNEMTTDTSTEEKMESVKLTMSIVENCLIEPSYEDIKNAGIELTDEQIIAIQSYALQGIEKADKFRSSP